MVRVNPAMTTSALLKYICEKRHLSAETHSFDLPPTEGGVANRTLDELKINSIKVISKCMLVVYVAMFLIIAT